MEALKKKYPKKFVSDSDVFSHIRKGDRIFIGTGCGEPQYLIKSLREYLENNPKAFFDTEVLHIWSMGIAPYVEAKFKSNFRQNTFFIGDSVRSAVNDGLADYTPIFLSQVPGLFEKKMIPIDVALIQTSLPDKHGFLSLGISVDIVQAAVKNAEIVVVQMNANMPRILGDSFVHIDDVDFLIHHDEDLLEFLPETDSSIVNKIGKYVARLIEDGDTLQVGYGSIPNAILSNLDRRKNLGIHTELISDGIVELMQKGVINNSKKNFNYGKTIASFCMAKKSTYEFLNDNPAIEFHPMNFTNDPLNIARNDNMVAINSALEIDITGQATSESLGSTFYSGIGGQADFMRGAMLSKNGKTILTVPSITNDGKYSRVVPALKEGGGTSLVRGDTHYVITEYGIAYLHGKNIRERAMALISIAHPKFRPWLIEEAKKRNLIFKDQAFMPGKKGEYPEHLETYRTTEKGFEIFLRPVKMTDEPLLKDFFYSLSDESLYRRFISSRKDMPHERLQDFVVINYSKEMLILAIEGDGEKRKIVGIGQYGIDERSHSAEVAFVTLDDYQNKGIGTELLRYLTLLARKQGLLGFTAEVLVHNITMLHLFEKMGFDIEKEKISEGTTVYELNMRFRG